MSKIRSISIQALLHDVELADTVKFKGTILYGLLIDIAEDSGCFLLNSKQIHLDLEAHKDEYDCHQIEQYLDILIQQKKIIPYQIKNKWYGWLKNSRKFQPDLNFYSNPTLPLPDFIKFRPKTKEQKQGYEYAYNDQIGDTYVQTYVDTHVYTPVVTSSKSSKSSKSNINTPPIPPHDDRLDKANILTESFNKFWDSYPKKKAKQMAWKAWEKLQLLDVTPSRIIEAVKIAKKTPEWKKDNGQFIPFPATFLNQHRWEDEDFNFVEPIVSHLEPIPEEPEPDYPICWCCHCSGPHIMPYFEAQLGISQRVICRNCVEKLRDNSDFEIIKQIEIEAPI